MVLDRLRRDHQLPVQSRRFPSRRRSSRGLRARAGSNEPDCAWSRRAGREARHAPPPHADIERRRSPSGGLQAPGRLRARPEDRVAQGCPPAPALPDTGIRSSPRTRPPHGTAPPRAGRTAGAYPGGARRATCLPGPEADLAAPPRIRRREALGQVEPRLGLAFGPRNVSCKPRRLRTRGRERYVVVDCQRSCLVEGSHGSPSPRRVRSRPSTVSALARMIAPAPRTSSAARAILSASTQRPRSRSSSATSLSRRRRRKTRSAPRSLTCASASAR